MRVIVGQVRRPHGIRGEVAIAVTTDEPDLRFALGATVDAGPDPVSPGGRPHGTPRSRGGCPPPRTPLRLTVASARWDRGHLLVTFAGITDRTAAAELTGTWLSVDSGQLPQPEDPDEFRDHDLIGLSVRTAAGEPVGEVTDVLHHGQDLLVVRRPGPGGEECLVPFVKAIVPGVDVAAGLLVIDPPRGLLDPAQAEE